jgi:hypothetical protein
LGRPKRRSVALSRRRAVQHQGLNGGRDDHAVKEAVVPAQSIDPGSRNVSATPSKHVCRRDEHHQSSLQTWWTRPHGKIDESRITQAPSSPSAPPKPQPDEPSARRQAAPFASPR